MADSQISSPATGAGSSTYTIKPTVEFTLKAVNALFTDNGAAGDWLPAVVIRSDAGLVIARAADQAVLVTGGDDAEVSWFPGVKNAGAGFAGLPWAAAHSPVPAAGYPSGTVETPAWGATALSGGTPLQNSAFHFTPPLAAQGMNVSAFGTYAYTVRVDWAAAFAGVRYVEIDIPQCDPMPQRFEQTGTPEGDTMILSGIFFHGRAADDQVSVNILQASGAPQGVSEVYVRMVELPPGP